MSLLDKLGVVVEALRTDSNGRRDVRDALRPQSPPGSYAGPSVPVGDVLAAEDPALRADYEREKRIRWEFFALIEQIERERNQWKKMFLEQAGQHQAAQAKLEEGLSLAGQMYARALTELNAHRKEKGTAPAKPYDFATGLFGTAEAYGQAMAALRDTAPAGTDGKAVRDQILRREGVEGEAPPRPTSRLGRTASALHPPTDASK